MPDFSVAVRRLRRAAVPVHATGRSLKKLARFCIEFTFDLLALGCGWITALVVRYSLIGFTSASSGELVTFQGRIAQHAPLDDCVAAPVRGGGDP